MKKLKLHGETAYILATALLSLAVAMVAAADFGISMVVAPEIQIILSVRLYILPYLRACA